MNDELNNLTRSDLLTEIARLKQDMKLMKDFIYGAQISSARIKNLTWDKGRGGTLTLGGLDNQEGFLSLLDALSVEKVLIDKDGILIRDGKIIIQNSNGDSFIDEKGIISETSFPSNQVFDSTIRTTTSTSLVDVPGSTLSPFTLERTARVLILITLSGYNFNWVVDGSTMHITAVSSVDGAVFTFPVFVEHQLTNVDASVTPANASLSYNADYQTKTCVALVDLSAGVHTLKLQFKVVGAGTAEIGAYQHGYVILGS